jgi:hypothetical protein
MPSFPTSWPGKSAKRVFALDVSAIHAFDMRCSYDIPHRRVISVSPSTVASNTGDASTAWM